MSVDYTLTDPPVHNTLHHHNTQILEHFVSKNADWRNK